LLFSTNSSEEGSTLVWILVMAAAWWGGVRLETERAADGVEDADDAVDLLGQGEGLLLLLPVTLAVALARGAS
jgi:hypothetical protein